MKADSKVLRDPSLQGCSAGLFAFESLFFGGSVVEAQSWSKMPGDSPGAFATTAGQTLIPVANGPSSNANGLLLHARCQLIVQAPLYAVQLLRRGCLFPFPFRYIREGSEGPTGGHRI